jgi:hypothetical protein
VFLPPRSDTMNPEGATPASLGFGVERHIAKSRAARDANEKIEHLTCALEALLHHLSSLEGDAREARGATAQTSESAEVQTADAGLTPS